ncbi:hypothetical protein AB1Y20_021697 [Prymnesium parvum]|uniref:Methyltransferase FkbM domain-containing protein n=1 Tax=Prymnesium parvum TaxID=97485 RepID=A0AB34JMY0_PRYPA
MAWHGAREHPAARLPHWGHLNTTQELHCVLQQSRSNEDIALLPLLLAAARAGKAPSGTFVEIGAFDGQEGSQTLLLERCFGWRGVLIEASPQNYGRLRNNSRSRETVKIHSAVCEEKGEVTMQAGGGTVAGVVGQMATSFAAKWKTAHKSCDGLPCLAAVPCQPLPAIMIEAGFPRVNFLSLDVEGAEEVVMKTVMRTAGTEDDFPFDVVMVEIDHRNRTKDDRVVAMIKSAGLKQIPIPQAPGSRNALFVRPTIGDTRPSATVTRPLGHAATANSSRLMMPLFLRSDLSPYIQRFISGESHVRPSVGKAEVAHRLASGLPKALATYLEHSEVQHSSKH